ncbi:3-hydroxyacyl-CoA dehydrogenase [Lentilactobacillus otakiensis]|uniref:3-hydroxybutyryl-CoA dehydrogenase n=1 Tax=Lentilactobacillus otakiensis DSM 19908 = JCM 15040 TaxID=1423780 RepID=S4NS39_9LACO|nr:3-hydroxyacyl-CoA dehydrogenase [Lentilactobacillus otakiensis]KRL11638.1 3-hydroxyacyl-CoA dehydrogenase [Lentilactobacillus otakiensis DSM 19908 = JCM 15040]MBZ3776738.1 3-hydroxyacyl-CoA dehydrogenase [Lentilactobacillus otakiensis]MDV3519271.1 3-hydroxyacyl-CoA dehydrogenase [Lentilactobacillus otakiensis]GAD16758.1 3-hydroxybutyryl-CoA dehydrogenase [Lentilactobacillus otakiensis DSM 19908 = JCM 15040]
MTIKNVTVAGSGVLGSQIAFQTAFKGFNVTVYDINEEAINKAKDRIKGLRHSYKQDIAATDEDFEKGLANISYSWDLAKAVSNADLVIEAIPERPDIKKDFYKKLAKLAPKEAIFTSNSSTLIPSMFMEDTGRPAQFLNMHFANQVWLNNTAEIMGSPKTDPDIYKETVQFARNIGMIPIQLKKEQPGYILNSMLIPLLNAAQYLWADGVADPQMIDKTWVAATGAPFGPFSIIDIIGVRTDYNITLEEAKSNPKLEPAVKKLKEMLDEGKLGKEAGEGFYKYPNPAYKQKDFLKI